MTASNLAYTVKVNDFTYSLSAEEILNADITTTPLGDYNVIDNLQSVNVKLLDTDSTGKKQTLEIDGEKYVVEIKDELDLVLEQLGFHAVAAKQQKEIKAPMPGLVLDVAVTEGQAVQSGEKVLILEAMKMENSIMIQGDATIKKILVKPGQSVEKGQILVELE